MKKRVYDRQSIKRNLGLSTNKDVKFLQRMAADLDLDKTSIVLKIVGDTRYPFTSPKHVAVDRVEGTEKGVHGVSVQRVAVIEGEEIIVASFSVPHKVLCNPTNHVVYRIVLYSAAQLYAMSKHGGLGGNQYLLPIRSDGTYNSELQGKSAVYIGKTSQGIFSRYKQHLQSVLTNPHTVFHKYWHGNGEDNLFASIQVIGDAVISEKAYDLEEEYIAKYATYPEFQLLNTCSSRAAIKELFEKFPHLRNEKIDVERAEELRLLMSSRTAEAWQNPNYAEKVICNNPRNLDAWQVRKIRCLSSVDVSSREIAEIIGCSFDVVRRVLKRTSYKRIL